MSWEPLPEELQYFPNFLSYVLTELGLATDATLQQADIAEWVAYGPNESITCGFRGVAKSFIGPCVYSLWRLRSDPFYEKILVTAATAEKAGEIATMVSQAIGSIDILRCLEPEQGRRSSTKAFDVANASIDQVPSMRIVGIFSPAVTGKRSTCVVADDVETLHNTVTQQRRERLATAVTELTTLLKPDDPGFRRDDPIDWSAAGLRQLFPRRLMYYGTPHLEESLYWKLTRERGFSIRFWPARFPNPASSEEWDCYEGNLAPGIADMVRAHPQLAGAPTDPERFPEDDLLKREKGMTPARWQLQFMLNTRISTADRYPIRLGDLMVMDLDGSALPELVVWGSDEALRAQELVCIGMGADRWYYKPQAVGAWIPRAQAWRCVLAIDPSGRGHDELAWAIVAELNGNLFALDSGGTDRGYEPDVLKLLAQRAKKWNCNACRVESNFGDGMFTALLQPVMAEVHPLEVEEVRVSGAKEARMTDILAPVTQNHRLVMARHLIKAAWIEAEKDSETGHLRSLPYQLSRLTAQKGCLEFLDRADALSIAINHFTESAAQDQRIAAKRREEDDLEAMLEMFLDDTGAGLDAIARGHARMASSNRRTTGGLSRSQLPL